MSWVLRRKGLHTLSFKRIGMLFCFAVFDRDILLLVTRERYKKIFFFLKIVFIFRERVREGGREGEKQQCVVASQKPPTGDLARNPGVRPGRESNWWCFSSLAGTQATEPPQPGQSGSS